MAKEKKRRSQSAATAVALTIAGSDSSAGAGVQADLKTFSAFGIYGLTAVTCVVAETPGKVVKIDSVSAATVRAQIETLFESFPIAAIKTGLLYSGEIVAVVASALAERAASGQRLPPLVIDPVMVATSGELLWRDDAITHYEQELFPLASLITPNIDEAAKLSGKSIADLATMQTAGEKLAKKYRVPILLKGGHLRRGHATDLLFYNGRITKFTAPFTRGIRTHGTGCTYSAAIAAGLAHGLSLERAVRSAKKFVSATIARHLKWQTSAGTSIYALNHLPKESRG
jgi:hydroxymethylpyrimidine/phosphomethylpyrimidine kinase